MDRYGEALEADLHRVYQLDLVDFFRIVEGTRVHSWRKLLNLIRHLRLSDRSLFVQAQSDDPEYAEWVVEQKEMPRAAPPLADWTPDHDVLVSIKDRLAELIAVTIGTHTGRYRQPPSSRYPVTEADRVRSRKRLSEHNSLVVEVREAQARWELHGMD